MLHTVNKSPFQNNTLESCQKFITSGDIILLIEDGVYGAMAGSAKSAIVEGAIKSGTEVYALSSDLKARAITNLIDGVQITDYAGFVDFVEKHKTHSWL
ncbi:MAG: sulfurtransferase complex subunit TusB [Magnetococcales bacterium]|nr:sulfurtransferase complex subunit TusB [Magnetococcales bacterium]